MKERSFDEMIAYFNRRVSEMDIAQDCKMELLGMVTALGYKHEKFTQPELTDELAIEHLQSTGWMQNHDKEMYEAGLRERLADDSDSYDSLIPSAQPLVLTCDGCRFINTYDTKFPCSRCIRMEKDYYDQER